MQIASCGRGSASDPTVLVYPHAQAWRFSVSGTAMRDRCFVAIEFALLVRKRRLSRRHHGVRYRPKKRARERG